MTEEAKPSTISHQGRIIQDEIETSASPQQAWEAWVDLEKIAHWFVDRAAGEAKPGGTMTWFFDDFGYVLPFKVVDTVPGRLFVLKWEPPQGLSGIMEVTIESKGASTLIRLVQSGFREGAQWNEEYEGTKSGWKMPLAILKYYLENFFGRPKTVLLILRPASFTFDQLRPYFIEPSQLARWLTASSTAKGVGGIGDGCRLELRDVGTLTGRVLADTGREVTLSWHEMSSTFELKGFSMGPQKMAGIRVMSWNLNPEKAQQLKERLTASVERLAALFPASAAANASAAPTSQFATSHEDNK